MQTYVSHKEVRASKIIGFTIAEGGASLVFEDGGQFVPREWLDRIAPGWGTKDATVELVGGYYVQYDDAYASWSPPGPFEQGYTLKAAGAAQGLPVAGYKPTQPAWAVEAVNGLKHAEERAHRLLDDLVAKGTDVDQRAVALARTGLQQAFMWAARGVFQPSRIGLPEDPKAEDLFTNDAKGG